LEKRDYEKDNERKRHGNSLKVGQLCLEKRIAEDSEEEFIVKRDELFIPACICPSSYYKMAKKVKEYGELIKKIDETLVTIGGKLFSGMTPPEDKLPKDLIKCILFLCTRLSAYIELHIDWYLSKSAEENTAKIANFFKGLFRVYMNALKFIGEDRKKQFHEYWYACGIGIEQKDELEERMKSFVKWQYDPEENRYWIDEVNSILPVLEKVMSKLEKLDFHSKTGQKNRKSKRIIGIR